jgi:16S rRNA (cytosine1402-N4)-methyltransferase
VLLGETLRWWRTGPGLYLDATLGDGGHAEALLDAEPGASLLGCDRDPDALASSLSRLARFGDRVTIAHATFRELPAVHGGREALAGTLLDLGVSSRQIDDPARGMSFRLSGPLDLRMDPSRGETAAQWLAGADVDDVAAVLREHGDVRDARRSHAASCRRRAPARSRRRRTWCVVASTRRRSPSPRELAPIVQALRIHMNDEALDLEAVLDWLPRVTRPGGVVVTLAYHSGEDRRIKHAMRGDARAFPSRRRPPLPDVGRPEQPWEALTRKVVTPTSEEIARNPRARSARLRAFRRNPS